MPVRICTSIRTSCICLVIQTRTSEAPRLTAHGECACYYFVRQAVAGSLYCDLQFPSSIGEKIMKRASALLVILSVLLSGPVAWSFFQKGEVGVDMSRAAEKYLASLN